MPVPAAMYRQLCRSALLAISLLLASAAWGGTSLSERYQLLKSGAAATLPGTTISLVSAEQDGVLSADVTSILPYPYTTAAPALAEVANWCQFMPLHFNIKACTFETNERGEVLTLYSGRKTYQAPDDSYTLSYRVEKRVQSGERLALLLHADSGPAGTRDYRIEVDAMPVKEGTLFHIRSSYRTSMTSALLTNTYLSTLGRDKVGFTLVEQGGGLRPVQGVRGVIERNVMRYQLAIDAFLDAQTLPESSRREASLRHWFRQNENYPQQLHEMTEKEYLGIKSREWDNQQRLQLAVNRKHRLAALHDPAEPGRLGTQ